MSSFMLFALVLVSILTTALGLAVVLAIGCRMVSRVTAEVVRDESRVIRQTKRAS